jgi:uncharacterized protein
VSSLLRRPLLHGPLRVEPLTDLDSDELIRLIDEDPVVNAVVSSRLRALGTLDARRFGGLVLGARDHDGDLRGAVFSGGNLLPIGGDVPEWHALAAAVLTRRRVCSSIVGRAPAVAAMWSLLGRGWAPARAVRSDQPLLLLDGPAALGPGDPRVRPVGTEEIDAYLPAAAAMFTEELGVSPYLAAGAGDYRRRVAGVLQEGRGFAIVDTAGAVIFKADLGAVCPHTCQVQGVWVRPDLRGQGLGTAATAAVLRHALTLAPTVSLYVNDFNVAARRMYQRLGLRETAVLSTVLF